MASEKQPTKGDSSFNKMISFRGSEEIEAIIKYHAKSEKDALGKNIYNSEGHFIRSAILFFDRVKRGEKKNDGDN